MNFSELSHSVIGYAIEVHRNLGPGLLESTYEQDSFQARRIAINGHHAGLHNRSDLQQIQSQFHPKAVTCEGRLKGDPHGTLTKCTTKKPEAQGGNQPEANIQARTVVWEVPRAW